MPTREEELFNIMMSFVSAPSLEAARAIVRQYPSLSDPNALVLLEQMIARAHQAGKIDAFNKLGAARQRLALIQSGK